MTNQLESFLNGEVALPSDFLWIHCNSVVKVTRIEGDAVTFENRQGKVFQKTKAHCLVNFVSVAAERKGRTKRHTRKRGTRSYDDLLRELT